MTGLTPDCTPDCEDHYFELRIRTHTHPETYAIAWGWSRWVDALTSAVQFLGTPLVIAATLAEIQGICFDGDGVSGDDDVLTHGEVVRTRPSCPHFDTEVHTHTYKFRRSAAA